MLMSARSLLYGALLATLLLLPRTASACPMCAEAVPDTSAAEAKDAERESTGYNQSIYLMAGMPYLLLGGMGLLIYRGYRRQAKNRTQQPLDAAAGNGGSDHVRAPLPANPSEDVAPGRSDG
jgi:hypothetical protein